MTVSIDNSQYPFIIDSGAQCSIVAINYLDNHFPNWEIQLLPLRPTTSRVDQGRCVPLGQLSKIQLCPIGKRIYGIDIYNSKNRNITIGTNKEKKFSLYIYQISVQDPNEEVLNEFVEQQFRTTLTSKQKLSLLKMLRKNRPEFSIGEEPLGKIRVHDIQLYLNVERPYPPMLRRPPYPASLETRKEIEK
ncbi:hypothetical protein O181_012874 [Austropuccinia psidii MF-1]|uniref:Uncharacterized protein n=1 Tax=Austropuccinia psidii MF-1 TaxID=1389203 RepID=A0A9Q3BVD4_9BASI|nr:hypothetical protein [Austropuccinia psidii MF-1]